MPGILAYGGYVPYYRLARSEIGAALGTAAAPGARAVAGYDEDTTSMAVEAGRVALAAAPPGVSPGAVYFATAEPAYADKTNATAIHAALGLDPAAFAVDMAGAVRSGVGALRAGLDAAAAGRVALVLVSDVRTGLPGGGDEGGGGDGAAALLLGDGPEVIAEPRASAHAPGASPDRRRPHRLPAAAAPGHGGRPDRRRHRPGVLPDLPHLAGPAAARAPAPARPGGARGAGVAPPHGLEVRIHRQPLPGLRGPPPPSDTRVREVPRRGPDGPRAPGRRARYGRDVHGRPACLLAVAPGDRRCGGLRRGREAAVRADRRRPRAGEGGRSSGDDVPAPVHRRRRAQLFLEGPPAGGGRREGSVRLWRRGVSATGWRSWGWAARRSASTGTRAPTSSWSTRPPRP